METPRYFAIVNFNPLPHTRENVNTFAFHILINQFQSTPSYEGELSSTVRDRFQGLFQSTPSYEGEHIHLALTLSAPLFQSTPSYEGEQQRINFYLAKLDISIHSLIRGRTAC